MNPRSPASFRSARVETALAEPASSDPATGDLERQRERFVLPANGLVFEELERDLVRQALERTLGNQARAARLLGMTRDQIRYRIRKFGLAVRPDAASTA